MFQNDMQHYVQFLKNYILSPPKLHTNKGMAPLLNQSLINHNVPFKLYTQLLSVAYYYAHQRTERKACTLRKSLFYMKH